MQLIHLLDRSDLFLLSPVNTMWRKLLHSGFETCFGPSTQGAGTKTHLKSRFCAILEKGAWCKCLRLTDPAQLLMAQVRYTQPPLVTMPLVTIHALLMAQVRYTQQPGGRGPVR